MLQLRLASARKVLGAAIRRKTGGIPESHRSLPQNSCTLKVWEFVHVSIHFFDCPQRVMKSCETMPGHDVCLSTHATIQWDTCMPPTCVTLTCLYDMDYLQFARHGVTSNLNMQHFEHYSSQHVHLLTHTAYVIFLMGLFHLKNPTR